MTYIDNDAQAMAWRAAFKDAMAIGDDEGLGNGNSAGKNDGFGAGDGTNNGMNGNQELMLTKSGPQKKTCCQKFVKFLFSEFGLLLVVCMYIVFGGFIFMLIELPNEKEAAESSWQYGKWIKQNWSKIEAEIHVITAKAISNPPHSDVLASGLIPREWAELEYKKLLDQQQKRIIQAIEDSGYDGTIHGNENTFDSSQEEYGWNLLNSILFAATILTTIGYGHISPDTAYGQLICIVYTLMAIPLFSAFLLRVGSGVAKLLIAMYNKCLCRGLSKKRKAKLRENLGEMSPPRSPAKTAEKSEKKKKKGKGDKVEPAETDVPLMPKRPPGQYDKVIASTKYHYDRAPAGKCLVLTVVFVYTIIGMFIFSWTEEKWSLVNSLYCCIITLTTIGFGDLYPGSEKNPNTWDYRFLMLFAAVYIIAGLAILGMAIDVASSGSTIQDDEEGPVAVEVIEGGRPMTQESSLPPVKKPNKRPGTIYQEDNPDSVSQPPVVRNPPESKALGTDTIDLTERAQSVMAKK